MNFKFIKQPVSSEKSLYSGSLWIELFMYSIWAECPYVCLSQSIYYSASILKAGIPRIWVSHVFLLQLRQLRPLPFLKHSQRLSQDMEAGTTKYHMQVMSGGEPTFSQKPDCSFCLPEALIVMLLFIVTYQGRRRRRGGGNCEQSCC